MKISARKLNKLSFLLTNNRRSLRQSSSFGIFYKQFSSSCACSANSKSTDKTTVVAGIPNVYNAMQYEEATGERWKNREDRRGNSLPLFRMALPPPNITGRLHLGHALTAAIEDSIARLKRMSGSNVEWIPGFDHAGIATHSIVLRKLQFGVNANNPIQPEAIEKELRSFAKMNREVITKQLKILGSLLDWEKVYYTLDANHSEAVREAFIHLFENGTISRGNGIINWSCKLESTISDVEVEHANFTGKTSFLVPGYEKPIDFGLLYHCSYRLENSDQTIIVATSRPETIFGDVAVAVHPNHSTYSQFIGSNVVNPLNGNILPVVGDTKVKLDFGTGAMKITPAHDKVDFVVGKTHNLPSIQVLTHDGKMNDKCGNFEGLGRFTARRDVIDFLVNNNALSEIQEYNGSIGLCSRSHDIVEAMLLPHWFFKTETLTDRIIKAVDNNEISIKPDNQKQILRHTLAEAHDWCISRQIKWGHTIPAYFHKDFPDKWVAAHNLESAVKKLEEKLELTKITSSDVKQDGDVLDTWFSSALVPLTLCGWPNSGEFQELSLMETGNDILVYWVWRMMLMSLALTEQLPFKNVLLHGIVTDYYGRKMSKSRGNVIDPMHIVHGVSFQELMSDAKVSFENGDLTENEYKLRISGIKKDYPKGFSPCGADALRFALLGQDISDENVKLDQTYLENCTHFCNKLWQAMRFYLLHKDEEINHPIEIANPIDCLHKLSFSDRWILSCLYKFVQDYEEAILSCKFHTVTTAIRTFFYSNYCDVYLELVKKDFQEEKLTELHMMVMRYVFCTGLKLAHPFLPFVTEEIWFHMTEDGKKGLLLDQSIPTLKEMSEFEDNEAQNLMKHVLRIVREIRHFRNKHFQGAKEKPQFYVEIDHSNSDLTSIVQEIETLSRTNVKVEMFGTTNTTGMMSSVFELENGGNCRISFLKSDVVPPSADQVLEAAGNLVKLQGKLDKLRKQMDNPAFQQYAPPEAKAKLKRRLDTIQNKINLARGMTSLDNDSDSSS